MSNFVHLHVHSEYSLLDGLPHPHDLATRASELQQHALALTDHGSMFAAIEFYDACKAKGVKPIIGVEAYLARRSMKDRDAKEDRSSYHLLLLAENNEGYQNLLKLVSAAQLEGYYYYPRIDHELLAKHSAGIICTTGCPSSQVPRLLHDGRKDEARKAAAWYRDVFNDRFFVELQEHGIAEFAGLDKELIALAREFNLPLVATNDAHYLRPEDANAQDILLCIQTNTVVTDPKRMRMDGSDYYLKSSEEMAQVWREFPEALANTLLIAERCNVDLDFKGYHLPIFPVPDGITSEAYLRKICEEGFNRHYPQGNPAARERLEYELDVIHKMGFDTYFLIVWDLCRAAREMDIWYNVRGSAAGSMAAYCADITNLDPIQHRLIFERFLNPGRISMPDIDLDFPDDRRAELIEYTVRKYGRSNVAQIVTFGTLGAKAAIRDVGRALDYPLNEVDRVAKLVPGGPNIKLDDSLEKVAELKEVYENNDYLRNLIDTARLLEGVARHAGTHAAGVVVADKPLVEYAPLHRPTKGDETTGFPVVQFEMNYLERVGLLKMDYLGLATLTIMRRACELIAQRHGQRFDLGNIPTDDPKAFDLLARGDVTGVFQVEGAGLRKVLQQMKPSKFDHIVAAISLYRPGPMEYIPDYIDRMHGVQKVTYRHPSLEPILADTFAIMVYQEQIIEIAVKLAGYSASEGDVLRKAVGKKDKEKLLKERDKFVEHAGKHGVITREIAGEIFDDVEYFARYGFNKAHAADYAVLTCQTAFLKAHYAIEYMTALLTTETGNVEKIGQLTNEARRMGFEIVPPDVNASEGVFTIDASGKRIHFSLNAIKNVGSGAVDAIVAARNPSARSGGGGFKSLDDFCRRVDLRVINRRVLESLIKAGALDRFGRRAQLLKVLDRMMAASQSAHQASDRGQLSMFGSISAAAGVSADTFGTLPDEPENPNRQKLEDEKELTGAYFSDNPLQRLTRQTQKGVSHFANQLDESLAGQMISLAGVVTSARVITTKKGDPMAFVQIEEPSGHVEITVFPKTYKRTKELWQVEQMVTDRGKVELREGKIQVLCENASELKLAETSDAERMPTNEVNAVQIAIANEDEAALVAEMDADLTNLPPPPEEPPEDSQLATKGGALTVNSEQKKDSDLATKGGALTVNSEHRAVNSGRGAVRQQTTDDRPQTTVNGERPADAKTQIAESKQDYALPPIHGTGDAVAYAGVRRIESPRHLRIYFERADDHEEEVRRMRELLALLRSVPGRDRFTFFVPNPQGIVQLDFPNFTTTFAVVEEPLSQLVSEWGSLEIQ
ncbi:MAG: DNA polymerase III subunit alpha [Chloroflexi bacterium]|nr:DNA polymerase III subunit alpha [Chloroflexota bacterium]